MEKIYGCSGLANLGNTCYFNSIIQCLSNCKPFKEYLLSKEYIKDLQINQNNFEIEIKQKLSFELRKLFCHLWKFSKDEEDYWIPSSFKKLFSEKIIFFQNSQQHDSQEALLCLLDSFQNEIQYKIIYDLKNNYLFNIFSNIKDMPFLIKNIQKYPKEYLHYLAYKSHSIFFKKYSKINEIFNGIMITQLTCPNTNISNFIFEPFYILTLPIPNEVKSNQIIFDNLTTQLSEFKNSSDEQFSNDEQHGYLNNEQFEFSNDEHSEFESESDSESESESEFKFGFESESESESEIEPEKIYNLYECLDLFIKDEILDDDNKWFSPYCKEYVNATKQILLWETPEVLIINFKRFKKQNLFFSKNKNMIEFPINNLDISKYIHSDNPDNIYKYNLFAVNNHIGNQLSGNGHYFSYCKNSNNNKWYKFNDETVTEIDEANIITNNAYILFYIKNYE